MSEFIFMLTQHDQTVPNAMSVCREISSSGLRYAGFKDVGLPLEQLKELAKVLHDGGQKVVLEVVNPSKDEELRAADNAAQIGSDYVMGGTHAAEIAKILDGTGIEYFPFPGKVINHPSDLRGSLEEIVRHSQSLATMPGVHGLDLLAYRWDGDVPQLIRSVVRAVEVPVVIAGSIDRDERIRTVVDAGAWGFTIGSALFDGKYCPECRTLEDKIKQVLRVAAGQSE
jgi:uncharacterized protein related to proFAR isomerase